MGWEEASMGARGGLPREDAAPGEFCSWEDLRVFQVVPGADLGSPGLGLGLGLGRGLRRGSGVFC